MIRAFAKERDGAIAAIAAVLIVILVGGAVFAYDASRAWSLQSELQSAADAAALAGASQLDNEPGAITRAIQAASDKIKNSQTWATDGEGSQVTFDTTKVSVADYTDITFWQDREKTQAATGDSNANYIEVNVQPRDVTLVFGPVLGLTGDLSPFASATAHLGAAVCKVPPLFFCVPDSGTLQRGDGMWLKGKPKGSSGDWFPGNFGILALNNPDGSTSLSANLIRDAMGREPPIAECYGLDESVQTKPGETTTIRDGLNVRFNIYKGSSKDLVGDLHYLPAGNTTKGLVTPQGSKCSYNASNPQGWHKPSDPYEGPSSPGSGVMGLPRDDCAYPGTHADAGTCIPDSTEGTAGRFGDGDWDITTYRERNHDSYSSDQTFTDAVCAASGTPCESGDPASALTRYDVYLWEQLTGNAPSEPDGTPADGSDPDQYEHCTPDPSTGDDRRVITMVGLDCDGLSGTSVAQPESFHEVLLTEPMGVYDGSNSLYAEYIGETTPLGNTKARFTLQLTD